MRSFRPSRRAIVRLVLRSAVVAGAVTLTVALAGNSSESAFTAVTGDGGNQAAAAASFCASPGGQTLTPSADSTGYQSSPATTYATNVSLGVLSAGGANARAVVRFSLPPLQPHCEITSATLRLRANSPQAGRTVDVYRVDPAAAVWTEAGISWNTLPPTTGAGIGSASLAAPGWQEWTVTSMLPSLYSGVNNGFLLRDRTENSGSSATNVYDSRDTATAANRPQLVLAWN